jgi:hypothetical protein
LFSAVLVGRAREAAVEHRRTGRRQSGDEGAGLFSAVLVGRAREAAESFVAHLLDDAAYSVGVWQGVIARHNPEPVRPRVRDLPRLRRAR